ncbi:hypothetical protein Ga0074812_105186 [Parafrankia irregularis]|uniref:Uncharacterized protein n=2 Tax=Frankiaceae TaxID=74712 RepID=A0A0S4QJS8_9ACTN|nr:hypothetical protein [Parafrankia sp. CH37]CUU55534.1 hypothetical protein Ga0074812_105186 [Parafrankia irregularis]
MVQAARKQRSDKGRVRVNARDFRCLTWLLEMGSAYEDDLAIVLDPAMQTSRDAARAVVRRWMQADLVHADGLFANRGRIVRLTENGARLVGEVDHRADEPVTAAVHAAEAARTRLLLEHQTPVAGVAVVGWVSPRRWRAENEAVVAAGALVPDGVARLADGSSAAVQVERVFREMPSVVTAAVDLLRRFPRAIYAVPSMIDGLPGLVEAALNQAVGQIRADGSVPGTPTFVQIPDRLVPNRTSVTTEETGNLRTTRPGTASRQGRPWPR